MRKTITEFTKHTDELFEGLEMTVIKSVEMMVQNNTDCDLKDDPFTPLSTDDIMQKLARGREQNQNGEGIPFEEAMKKIGRENHFID